MPFILTCPASRGITFELTRQLLRTANLPIVATARKNLKEAKCRLLDGLEVKSHEERLQVLELDVCDERSISRVAEQLHERFPQSTSAEKASNYLHLALMTPGILYPEKSASQLDIEQITRTFQVNTISHMLLWKHFSPFLPKKSTTLMTSHTSSSPDSSAEATALPCRAVYALMSARVGSTSDNTSGGWYSYRASKAAVNSLARSFDIDTRRSAGDNSMVIALHPGTVKTEFSREFWSSAKKGRGLLGVEEASRNLLGVIDKVGGKRENGGRCWDWRGEEVLP
ncbi:hypothetical protein BOTBODRAFT_129835 [Botryobasidium botryosum FD-172 SS1]|uniref:NAD(P)-binding protein n=1 Tax=Botryobasidium botryosum (strain FD-172 SS1) TaxID=930990 RepID=A0A067MP22_BOTB1|nr:hypothetical protein BOTBODRAFT_129835 [Botryobasidium botryosum FD-172 SS1]